MRWCSALPLVLVACSGAPFDEPARTESPVVGGYEPGPELFGVGIGLREYERGNTFRYTGCTGTLVAPDVVISAAHCYDDPSAIIRSGFFTQPEVDVDVAGDFNALALEPGAAIASGFVIDPNADSRDFDVALVFLEAPMSGVPITRFPASMELEHLQVGATGLRAGYGWNVDSEGGDDFRPSDGIRRRRAVEVVVGSVTSSRFRTTNSPDETACPGDSGSPVFLRIDGELVLFGVHYGGSGREGCSDIEVTNRADAVMGWIASEMAKACERGTRSPAGCDAQRLPIDAPTAPAFPGGEALPTIDTAPVDVGDGPREEGGCRTAGRSADPWLLALLLALGWTAALRRADRRRHIRPSV